VLLNLQDAGAEAAVMLFVGDDWAEDHHDVEVVDDQGSVLARRRLPEGFDGIAALHALVATHLPEEWADLEPGQAQALVKIGIETDRGPWVAALIAAGYEVYAINPLSVARYRERHSTSGAKSDAADAHLLAEIVRLDRHHHRPVAGDSQGAEAIKLVARTHQSLIWDHSAPVRSGTAGLESGMARLRKPRRADGGVSYQVRWVLGGGAAGPDRTATAETFASRSRAVTFMAEVEAAGHDWPTNAAGIRWTKGLG
jgi:hypothetical protein